MTKKWKFILNGPRILNWNRRARKFGKQWIKFQDKESLSPQWRNDYILKLSKKYLKILGVKIEVEGYENLPKAPAILTPNHSCSFDPLFIIVALENKKQDVDSVNPISVFLAKKELEKNRKARGYFQMVNAFFVDRKKPREALKELNKMSQFAKKEKIYQIIFPEGTRTKTGELLEFKSGPFKMAKKYFMPIVPITIQNAFKASDLSRKKDMKIKVIFHKPIKPITFMEKEDKVLAKNIQTIIKKTLKEK